MLVSAETSQPASDIKLLRVSHTVDPSYGGPVSALLSASAALRDSPVTTKILHGAALTPEGHDVLEQLGQDRVELACLGRLLPYGIARKPRIILSAVSGSDVVHIHGLYTALSWQAALHAHRLGIPYVIEPHGALTDYHWSRKRAKKAIHERIVERRLLRSAAAVVVSSRREQRDVVKRFECSTVVLPRSVAEGGLSRATGVLCRPLRIGYIGRIDAKKNVDILVRAFGMLEEENVTCGCTLLIAAPPSPSLDALKDLALRLKINGIQFVGPQYGEKKWQFLTSIDVFCLPSSDESFGVVLAEAAIAGAAIVGTSDCGAMESFAASESFRVDATVHSVHRALSLLVQHPRLRASAAAAGRRRAIRTFTAEAVEPVLVTFYSHLKS